MLELRAAGIAHGSLGGGTIIVSDRGICLRDFRCAPSSRLDAEALDPDTVEAVAHDKQLLPGLREAIAAQAGIEVPQLAEAKRISWTNLLFAAGSLLGIWLIIGVLSGAGGALAAIKGASWGWVAMAFVLAQLSVVAEAWALLGTVVGQLPFGRCVALEVSNVFTSLVSGDVAVFAIRVRFFQRQGYDAAAAVSSGAIASTASWVVKGGLFLVAIPFAAGSFNAPSGSGGSHTTAVWITSRSSSRWGSRSPSSPWCRGSAAWPPTRSGRTW